MVNRISFQLAICFSVMLCCHHEIKHVSGLNFGYDGSMGPSHWGEHYNTCAGKYQSPININLLEVKMKDFDPLRFQGFNETALKGELINNGHTVSAQLEFAKVPTISGGPLKDMGVFQYSQFHFHWGDNDTFGSEDRINNISFPAELHMVFFNEKYDSVNEALTFDRGLVVLAFFFTLQDSDNPHYAELTHLVSKVPEPNNRASFVNPPRLRDLISTHLSDYFTYDGSLTTPPCSETVTWIDFEEPILISAKQIEQFRHLYTNEGLPMKHNFRPIQPLNNRTIYKSVSPVIETSLQNEVTSNHISEALSGDATKATDDGTIVLNLLLGFLLLVKII